MYRQLFWECAKRADGLIIGDLRLIVGTETGSRTRYFIVNLNVPGRNLVLSDGVRKKVVAEVNDSTPLPPDSPRLMAWVREEVLTRLLDCYRPIYVDLGTGIRSCAPNSEPVVDGAEQRFLWELAEQP